MKMTGEKLRSYMSILKVEKKNFERLEVAAGGLSLVWCAPGAHPLYSASGFCHSSVVCYH